MPAGSKEAEYTGAGKASTILARRSEAAHLSLRAMPEGGPVINKAGRVLEKKDARDAIGAAGFDNALAWSSYCFTGFRCTRTVWVPFAFTLTEALALLVRPLSTRVTTIFA